jgi:hypothetical protein
MEGFILRDQPAVGESRYKGVGVTNTLNNPFRAAFGAANLGVFPSEGEAALAFLREYLKFHAKHTPTPEPYSGFFLLPPPPFSQVGAEIEFPFGVVSIRF